jgi:hypothetical protein
MAATDKQRSRLSKLSEKPLDLDALEIIPGPEPSIKPEAEYASESHESNEEKSTIKKLKKEEKKKRKSLKKEKKEAKKRKSES